MKDALEVIKAGGQRAPSPRALSADERKLEKAKSDVERWVRSVLRASRKLEAARRRVAYYERRVHSPKRQVVVSRVLAECVERIAEGATQILNGLPER